MVKCAACGKFLAARGGATCSCCPNKYHLQCLLMPETAQVARDWACPDCKKKVPKGDNSATPVKGVACGYTEGPSSSEGIGTLDCEDTRKCDPDEPRPAIGDMAELIEEMRRWKAELVEGMQQVTAELRAVSGEVRDLRTEMSEFRSSLTACNQRVDGLEGRILALEKLPRTAAVDGEVGQLERIVAQLKLELDDRDQESLSSDLEIANLPEVSGESILHTVGLVATKLGVKLEDRDIVFAERVGPRAEQEGAVGVAPRARRIVVRLSRRSLRDELLRSARVRRGLTSADLGLSVPPRRFYLNERLTRKRKHILFRAREIASRIGWKYTWSKRGRVLAKQGDGKPTHSIRNEDDLVRVFGKEAVDVATE